MIRKSLTLAAALAAAAAPLVAQGDPRAFGTAGNTPFALKGQIYYLDEGTDHLPDFSALHPAGTISTTVLNVPAQSFEQGFPGLPTASSGSRSTTGERSWHPRPAPTASG